MARIAIDMRARPGYQTAVQIAGLCDLDIVMLVAKESPCNKALKWINNELKRIGASSKVSTIEMPCHTEDAAEVVNAHARSKDIIITDSALIALEFMKKMGEATNNRGERYTQNNVFERVERFHMCQYLKRQGLNPYKRPVYHSSDHKRLRKTLLQLIKTLCGATPREMPSKHRCTLWARDLVVLPPMREYSMCSSAKVFVDGDACPVLPAILEVCGNANVPITYVSNRQVTDLVEEAYRREPSFISRTHHLPAITIEQVPVKKNSTDRFIARNIAPGDIVLTDDNGLTARCLNKGAAAIDFSGCVCELLLEGGRIGKSGVSNMKAALSARQRKGKRNRTFKRSLEGMVR